MLRSTPGRASPGTVRNRAAARAAGQRNQRQGASAAFARARDRLRDLVIVDLFCGAGGATEACVRAIAELKNVPLDQVQDVLGGIIAQFVAVNHWPDAVATHIRNHPFANTLLTDVTQLDPLKAMGGRKRVHLLLAGPECYPAGTLILTERGLVPIEQVHEGDRVLTHRGRWRNVTAVGQRVADTVVVRGQGHYGLEVTREHPLYARDRKLRHRPVDGSCYRYTEPEWTPAGATAGKYWATPTSFGDELPIPPVGGRGVTFSPEFWWMVGRWLGDGLFRVAGNHADVLVVCGKHEADEVIGRLNFSPPTGQVSGRAEYRWRRRDERTVVVYEMSHTGLVAWLNQFFGRGAQGKTVPPWALGMPREWREALLAGYVSADGHYVVARNKQMASTVSKSLAVGIRLLAESLGHRMSLYNYPQHSNVIEGRSVNTRPMFEMRWIEARLRDYGTQFGVHSWSRVRAVEPGRTNVLVYNLSVEEDESYVADGIVCHNCTFHSLAAGDRPVNDQSRISAFSVLDWLEKLYVDAVIVENVPEFMMWGPLNADGTRNKKRKGEIFRKYISMMEALGYEVEYRILKAADYGDPTSRERLFILARRDGRSIVWPEPTHAHPKQLAQARRTPGLFGGASLRPYRTAAEIIDWDDRGTSIFNRDKPLSPNTMRRIWIGLMRYGLKDVLANEALVAEPFLVKLRNHGTAMSVAEPVDTLTAGGNHFGVVQLNSFLVGAGGPTGTARPRSTDEPVKTVLGDNRLGVVQGFLLPNEGVFRGNQPRPADDLVPSMTSRGPGHVVQPFMLGVGGPAGQRRPREVSEPTPTLTGTNSFAVVHPFMLGQQSGGAPRSTDEPAPTLATDGAVSLVQSFVMHVRGGDDGYFRGRPVTEPVGTVTTHPAMSLVQIDPFMLAIDQAGSRSGQVRGVDDVVSTLTTKARMGVAMGEGGLQPYPDGAWSGGDTPWQPFLVRYNGTGIGAEINEPVGTLTTKDRYALCLPVTRGYLLVDIFFRMFKTVEMARAHSYPSWFTFWDASGKPATKEHATKMVGNSWPIAMGSALALVQMAHRADLAAASETARLLMRGVAA